MPSFEHSITIIQRKVNLRFDISASQIDVHDAICKLSGGNVSPEAAEMISKCDKSIYQIATLIDPLMEPRMEARRPRTDANVSALLLGMAAILGACLGAIFTALIAHQ